MTELAKAQFTASGPGAPRGAFTVDFNPTSLKMTVTNTMQDDQQPGRQGVQSVRRSAIKLEVELLFDTTETGGDVRARTGVLRAMGQPGGGQTPSLPQVTFTWGLFSFNGVIESLQEAIDFFSSAGVPLRSTVQLMMQSLEADPKLTGSSTSFQNDPTVVPRPALGRGATDAATRAGNPAAGRAVAAANGLESMRFTGGAGLAVSGEVQLLGPVGFSASAGASTGAGFSMGAANGAGFAAGTAFGASASAGISAIDGAFGGLGISKSAAASYTLDVDRLRPPVATFTLSADPLAGFDATGRVVGSASAGLRADVTGSGRTSAAAAVWIG
jgi:hypothetical protein